MELIKPNYTRVSTVLSIFQQYSYVPSAKLKRAQDIGVDVHAAIETYFRGDFEPLSVRRVPYFESFLKWVEIFKPNPLLFEERFYDDKLMITGRIDLLARKDDQVVLIDFKTGSWAHPEIWELQATFYRYLLEINEYPYLPERFFFVQLMKDGSAPLTFEFKYDEKNFGICLSSWRCWKFFQKDVVSN